MLLTIYHPLPQAPIIMHGNLPRLTSCWLRAHGVRLVPIQGFHSAVSTEILVQALCLAGFENSP